MHAPHQAAKQNAVLTTSGVLVYDMMFPAAERLQPFSLLQVIDAWAINVLKHLLMMEKSDVYILFDIDVAWNATDMVRRSHRL